MWMSAVSKGTQLVVQPAKPQAPKERKLQARLSAFLGEIKPETGNDMHAVSVTSWLTDAEPEAQSPTSGGGGIDSPWTKVRE